MKSTGIRIQERREALGLTRDDLAKRLKTSRLKVWRIETGRTRVTADHLPMYAKALRTTVAELLA